MAMEVNRSSKQLPRQAVPIVMIMAALTILPAVAVIGYANTQTVAGGLTNRFISVRPATNGLADITFNNSASSAPSPAGSYLNSSLDQTGRQAQLWLRLQK